MFFGTLTALTIGYAAWNNPLSMSTVSSGSGLTANGWNALVNNLNDLDARITALTAPRGTLQFVQNHYAVAQTYAASTTRPGTEVTALATTITTTTTNSNIIYDLSLNGELHYDSVFILQRDIGGVITELGAPAPVGSRIYGIAPMIYDADVASTMGQVRIQFIDTPNVASGTVITYRLRFYSSAASQLLYLNRTVADLDTFASYERVSSNVRLQEFKP